MCILYWLRMFACGRNTSCFHSDMILRGWLGVKHQHIIHLSIGEIHSNKWLHFIDHSSSQSDRWDWPQQGSQCNACFDWLLFLLQPALGQSGGDYFTLSPMEGTCYTQLQPVTMDPSIGSLIASKFRSGDVKTFFFFFFFMWVTNFSFQLLIFSILPFLFFPLFFLLFFNPPNISLWGF